MEDWGTFTFFVIKPNGVLGEEKGTTGSAMLGVLTLEVSCECMMEELKTQA